MAVSPTKGFLLPEKRSNEVFSGAAVNLRPPGVTAGLPSISNGRKTATIRRICLTTPSIGDKNNKFPDDYQQLCCALSADHGYFVDICGQLTANFAAY